MQVNRPGQVNNLYQSFLPQGGIGVPRGTMPQIDPRMMLLLLQMQQRQQQSQQQGRQINWKKPAKKIGENLAKEYGYNSIGELINTQLGSGFGDAINQGIAQMGFPETAANIGAKFGAGQTIGTTAPNVLPTTSLDSIFGAGNQIGVQGGQATTNAAAASQPALGSLGGVLPVLGLGGMAYSAWNNFTSDNGEDFLKGQVNKQNSIDAGMNSNPVTGWINPTLKAFGLDSLGRTLGGKSTKEYQAERWGKATKDNPGWVNYYNQNQQIRRDDPNDGVWDAEDDPTGKYVGKKWSWDAQKDIMESSNNYDGLMGTLGHAEIAGDRWHDISFEKRREFIKKAYDEGLYGGDKGSTYFMGDKKDRAIQLLNETLGGDLNSFTKDQLNSAQSLDFRHGYGGQSSNKQDTPGFSIDTSNAQPLIRHLAPGEAGGILGRRIGEMKPMDAQPYMETLKKQVANFDSWNPNAQVTSGMAFDPNSKQYNNLSKSQKDAYWKLRNSGK